MYVSAPVTQVAPRRTSPSSGSILSGRPAASAIGRAVSLAFGSGLEATTVQRCQHGADASLAASRRPSRERRHSSAASPGSTVTSAWRTRYNIAQVQDKQISARFLAALAASAAGVVLVLAGWLVLHDPAEGSPKFVGSSPPPGSKLPRFALRDDRGRLLRSDALDGKVVLVTFLETKCREACPVIASSVRDALPLLPADQREAVVAIAISVQPADDTPPSVRRFLRRHRVEGRLRYLVGSEAELRPVWKTFQVLSAVESGDADVHSAPVRIFDPDGDWVSTLHSGVDLSAENLAHDARVAGS
jgi:protein SCO1